MIGRPPLTDLFLMITSKIGILRYKLGITPPPLSLFPKQLTPPLFRTFSSVIRFLFHTIATYFSRDHLI